MLNEDAVLKMAIITGKISKLLGFNAEQAMKTISVTAGHRNTDYLSSVDFVLSVIERAHIGYANTVHSTRQSG